MVFRKVLSIFPPVSETVALPVAKYLARKIESFNTRSPSLTKAIHCFDILRSTADACRHLSGCNTFAN
jgi:hypothetical protein